MTKKTEKKQEEAKSTKKSAHAQECKSSASCKKAEKKEELRTLKFVWTVRESGFRTCLLYTSRCVEETGVALVN